MWAANSFHVGLPAILKLLSKNLFIWSDKRTTFFGLTRTSKNFTPDLELLFSWLKSGKISVPIRVTFRLEEIQKAHREYASSSRMGSIVIEISR
jgi:NADPH:quinone reductase-like Zn-dependent oxidoreductase